jgi:hypothetical protein
MVKAATLIQEMFGEIIIRCFSYILQLDVIPIFRKYIPVLFAKILALIQAFSHSQLLQDELEAIQESLEMPRFNSSLPPTTLININIGLT